MGLIRNKTVKLFFGICPVYWGLVQLLYQKRIKNEIVFIQNAGHSPKSNELKEAYDQIFVFLDKL